MEPASASPSLRVHHPCRSGWTAIAQFALVAFFVGVSLTLFGTLLQPLVNQLLHHFGLPPLGLSWWRIFRRCASIAAGISLWVCIRAIEHRSFRWYGFGLLTAKREFAFGLALGVTALGSMLAIGLLSGVCRFAITPDGVRLWRTVLLFVPAAVLVAALEELVFRGYLLRHLSTLSTPLGVLLTSAAYAAVHVKELSFAAAGLRELFGLFLLGGVLAVSCIVTRHLALAMGLHAAFAYGARVNKLVIEFTVPPGSWFIGTSRLINGVASWIVLLVVGAVVLWWVQSRHRNRGGLGYEQA